MRRYERQIAFPPIGREGQEKLRAARVAVIGCGALGSASANTLARAGVGFLRLVDPDIVELTNLQRQHLYSEADLGRNKAATLGRYIKDINRSVALDIIPGRASSENLLQLVRNVDLVIDGTDSIPLRVELNAACRERKVPWIYGGVLGSVGMTFNFMPGGPCFTCLFGEDVDRREHPTTSVRGVISPITATVSAIQCAEAIKILIGSPDVRRELLTIDLWKSTFKLDPVPESVRCSICRSRAREAER